MKGQLVYLLGMQLPSYFVMLVTGFIVATTLGVLWARRIGRNPDVIVDLGLSMLVFGVIGARLLHVFADGFFWDYVHLCTDPEAVLWKISKARCLSVPEPDAFGALLGDQPGSLGRWDAEAGGCRPVEHDCFAWARFWAGGLTYYGGFIGAALAAWFLLRADRFPFWKAADMAGMAIPVGLAFGRMGCLLGGCCFGRPLHGPAGLVFPPHSPASVAQAREGLLAAEALPSLPVHATQLYEAWGSFLLALMLVFVVHGRKRYDGQVLLSFVGGYAALRFMLEFVRADDRGGFWGLSTSQLVGVGLMLVVGLAHRALRNSQSAAGAPMG